MIRTGRLFAVLLLAAGAAGRVALAVPALGPAQPDTRRMYEGYREDQYREELDERKRMQQEFAEKARRLDLLTQTETPVHFRADTQEYHQDEHLYLLTGNVELQKDDFTLRADSVSINDVTTRLEAVGDVEITFRKDVITCRKAVFILASMTGQLYDCRGALEPTVYFECAILEKLRDYPPTGLAQYAMTDGTITSCTGDETADWSIRAPQSLARVENYLHLDNPRFRIKDVPILWAPYWIYPIKTGRATGLLLPMLAWGNRRGLVFRDEFFWAITDNWDATFGVELYSKVGWAQSLESRWALGRDSRGEFLGTHVDESSSPSDTVPAEERWRLLAHDTHVYPWNIRQVLRLDFYSDEFFDRYYGTELESMATRAFTSSIAWTKRWNRGTATLDTVYTKNLDENLRSSLQRLPRLDLDTGQQRIGRSLLRWEVGGSLESLWKEGRQSSVDEVLDPAGFDSGTLEVQDWLRAHVGRADVRPGLRLITNPFSWLSVVPSAGYRLTWWSRGKSVDPEFTYPTWATVPEPLADDTGGGALAGLDRQGEGYLRRTYDFGVDLTGPKIYRIFERPGDEVVFTKVKHLIYPEVRFGLTPEVYQDPILELDVIDRIDESRAITYSLVNQILAKERIAEAKTGGRGSTPAGGETEADSAEAAASEALGDMMRSRAGMERERRRSGPKERVREIARFTLSHSYDFAKEGLWEEKAADYAAGESDIEPRRFDLPSADAHFQALVNPSDNTHVRGDVYFDPYERDFSRLELSSELVREFWHTRLGWSWNRNEIDEEFDNVHILDLVAGLLPTEQWGIETAVYYDIERTRWYRAVLDLTYHSQCWSITLNSRYGEVQESGVYPDWALDSQYQFGFTFTLRNIGEVGFLDLDTFAY